MTYKTKIFLQSVFVLTAFAIALQAFAVWVPPIGTPPTGGNTEPPINTSSTTQAKDGGIVAWSGLRSGTVLVVDGTSDLKGNVTIFPGKTLTLNTETYTFPANQTANGYLKTDGAGNLTWDVSSGGVSDGDKGDITVTGSGATWTIDPLTITTGKIVDNAVGNSKIADNAITNIKITDATIVATTKLSATGTKDSTTFLRGDNTWGTPTMGNLTGDVTSTGLSTTYNNVVPFAKGGTGLSSAVDDTLLVSNGSAWEAKALLNCPDSGGNHLNYVIATNTFSCGTSGGGGSVSFASVTTGTNTVALLTSGTLGPTGAGVITANNYIFATGGGTTAQVDLATTEVAGILPVGKGGTGVSSVTGGCMLAAETTGILVEKCPGNNDALRRVNSGTGWTTFTPVDTTGTQTLSGKTLTNPSFGSIGTTANAANAYYDTGTSKLLRSTSSIRYKKDVADLEIDTSKIYDLKPVSYTSKSDGLRYFGLIAEDVDKVVPALVDYIPEKNVIAGSTRDLLIPDSVKYPMLSVLLLKETQKHEAQINELKKENEDLRRRLEILEAKIK